MTLSAFLDGTLFALFLVVATFQLRSWRRTRDRLFLLFALSFAVLACNRAAIALAAVPEPRTYLYGVRLLAFLLILFAVWDKNRRSKRASAAPNAAGS